MAERYGTDLAGLASYEGDLTADSGETLITNDSDGSTALLFGPAALREIQAGVANGDFASAPDEPDADISDENTLPYFSLTDNSSGKITARVIEDLTAGSGNVLRFRIASGTTAGNNTYIERFVPVPGTRNRSFVFTPEVYCINATSTSNAKVVLSYQYYKNDQTTTTGTGDSRERSFTDIGSADTLRIATYYTRLAIPSDAAYILLRVKVETTGTVASQSDVSIAELRLIAGGSDLYIAENSTPATYAPARLRQVNGELSIEPNLGGSGTVVIADASFTGVASHTDQINVTRGSATNDVFLSKVSGDTVNRFLIEADGGMFWGNGSSARDVNLYRANSTTLQTDDTFSADFLYATLSVNAGNGNFNADGPTTTTASTNTCQFVLLSGTEYQIRRNTSSARYKTNIVPADDAVLVAARQIVPKHFESTIDNPEELGKTRLGFIAEEIHDAGLTHAVGYNTDGQPETLDHVALIAALWHRVNDLEERLAALEAE